MKRPIYILVILFTLILPVLPLFASQQGKILYENKTTNSKFIERVYEMGLSKQEKTPQKADTKKKFMFLAFGTLNFGQVTYYPYKPVVGDPSSYTYAFGPNSPEPYNFSYSFGVGIDYRILDFLSIFLDGGMNSWKLLLANNGGYAYGEWVAEATDWNWATVGPFSMDTYYYMDTTVMRIGARYIASHGTLQPWVGAGIGIYAWQATIGNKDEAKQYGNPDSGLSFGYSLLAGFDFVFGDVVLRLYGDYGSALAYPKISGLLADPYSTAVFENTAGEYSTGPYKIGCAVGFKY